MTIESSVALPDFLDRDSLASDVDFRSVFDSAWLTSKEEPEHVTSRGSVRIADLFSGCGALTLGAVDACHALGFGTETVLAVDTNAKALDTYARNFPATTTSSTPVERILDSDLGESPSEAEKQLQDTVGEVDVLLGGPPCQGNSDLNNHTRRADPKNALFLRMVRFAELVRPKHVVIENVPGVVHDRDGVVVRARMALESMGYFVDSAVVKTADLGVPQRRKRYLVVASLRRKPSLPKVVALHSTSERSVGWALGDLLGMEGQDAFDSSAVHYSQNKARIDYLFDHDLYDLPNEQRPDCHRLKPHSYNSVYGRMRWDQPAPTITSGFGSTGQGRFVHPKERRTVTPHEAARLQFVPDFFDFSGNSRVALQEMIGNAVPPKLAYAVVAELLK
ncbi:MAG: DNA cytosine methyltransferase [Actinomycetota bacterium]|nr:DNA cytosine methyltransferase [Actinomycetota bacterium]